MSVVTHKSPIPYLRPICAAMRWLCLSVAVLVVIASVAMAVAIPFARDSKAYEIKLASDQPPAVQQVERPNAVTRDFSFEVDGKSVPMTPGLLAVLAAAVIPAVLGLVWGLWNGAGLFKRLGRGEYFAKETVRAVRNFAIGLLVYKIAPLFAYPFLAASAAPHRQPGKVLEFSLNMNLLQMDGVLTVIFLGMVAVFAQVMTKAAEIAEDNAQIV